VIVLRIADPHGIMRRKAEDCQSLTQARSFADGLRQDHHSTTVEAEHQRQLESLEDSENPRSFALVSLDNRLSNRAGDTLALQLVEQSRWRRLPEDCRISAVGKFDHSAVLCDERIDEMQIAYNATQVFEHAARDEHDYDTLSAKLGYRLTHVRVKNIVLGYRAIEVQSED
jgi:hypothetical protein